MKKSAVSVYYPQGNTIPIVTAKGKNHAAEKIIQIARENNIPVVEDEVMENALSVQEIGECIPEETWLAIAQVFAYIQCTER